MVKFINIKLIAKIYLLSIGIFFCFRLILLTTQLDDLSISLQTFRQVLYAFLIGIRFDLLISSYILVIPFLVFSIMFCLNKHVEFIYKITFYYILLLFSVSFIICGIDIPYFNEFFSRFSVSAFQWVDSPVFVLKMIVEEPSYWLYIIPTVLLVLIYFFGLRKIFKTVNPTSQSPRIYILVKVMLSILVLGLMFVSIRGRIQKKATIKVGTAYFCDNSLINQLGLNPVFSLLRSVIDHLDEDNQSVHFMPDQVAISNVKRYLSIKGENQEFPIARAITPDSISQKKYNVVLILMESMSMYKTGRHGNPKNMTPFLDSLSFQGYYFKNFYSAGLHTYNGIFSSLFSYPAIFLQHPMLQSNMKKYNGLPNTLRKLGYSTVFFTTHDGQFDNMEGFLWENEFEKIVTQANYPAREIKTNLGVPDDYMFRYAIPVINELSNKNRPFFATLVTTSDHGPYYIPDYFHPRNSDVRDQIVEYADWSIQKFFKMATKQTWFENTIFVLTADHGRPNDKIYDISIDNVHIPLIIYAPGLLKESKTFDCFGGQIDLFPTVMGLLRQPYINNNLGIDLLKEKRPYIYFNSDDKYGVIDGNYILIVRKDGKKSLHKYQNGDQFDYITKDTLTASSMNDYAQSNLQVFQYIFNTRNSFLNN